MIQIKSKRELDKMREAGRHVGEILVRMASLVKPGITTVELDRVAREEIKARKLTSSFLNYAPGGQPPFPAVLCASINDEIVHGIPGPRRVVEGDLLKLDFGAICDGYHGDAALSLAVGPVDEESRRLLRGDATRRSRPASASSSPASDWATSARRCRKWSSARASRWCATSSATRSAAPCTSRRSSRTSASPAAASGCARAWCSRSSRW